MLLEGVEECGAVGIGGQNGRTAPAIVAGVSTAAGEGAARVIGGIGGNSARPAEGNIVLALKGGFIVYGEADLIGEDTGQTGGGLVGGAVAG